MQRENQTFIGIRLDPQLLAALDAKRAKMRMTRSQFVRNAIFEAVSDMVDQDLAYPQDRVGAAKGGRPRKPAVTPDVGKKAAG
jgi:metal-responsive CopG/Arc/MetJ family transcriptional regulator